MPPLAQMLVAALISLFLSLVVLRLLSRPLAQLLSRLCPDEAAAAFWLAYTQVMLTLAPLLATLLLDGFTGAGRPLAALRMALVASLIGLLVGLYAVGRRLGRFARVPSLGASAGEARS